MPWQRFTRMYSILHAWYTCAQHTTRVVNAQCDATCVVVLALYVCHASVMRVVFKLWVICTVIPTLAAVHVLYTAWRYVLSALSSFFRVASNCLLSLSSLVSHFLLSSSTV